MTWAPGDASQRHPSAQVGAWIAVQTGVAEMPHGLITGHVAAADLLKATVKAIVTSVTDQPEQKQGIIWTKDTRPKRWQHMATFFQKTSNNTKQTYPNRTKHKKRWLTSFLYGPAVGPGVPRCYSCRWDSRRARGPANGTWGTRRLVLDLPSETSHQLCLGHENIWEPILLNLQDTTCLDNTACHFLQKSNRFILFVSIDSSIMIHNSHFASLWRQWLAWNCSLQSSHKSTHPTTLEPADILESWPHPLCRRTSCWRETLVLIIYKSKPLSTKRGQKRIETMFPSLDLQILGNPGSVFDHRSILVPWPTTSSQNHFEDSFGGRLARPSRPTPWTMTPTTWILGLRRLFNGSLGTWIWLGPCRPWSCRGSPCPRRGLEVPVEDSICVLAQQLCFRLAVETVDAFFTWPLTGHLLESQTINPGNHSNEVIIIVLTKQSSSQEI